jgi:biotin transport system substrate-specific component
VLFLVGLTLVITLWTLGVLLIGATLGSRRAGLTLLVYLVEGAIGLPVFANLESGGAHLKVLAGSQLFFTEGIAGLDYLIRHSASIDLSFPLLACWSFPLAAYVTGWLFERLREGNFSKAALAMLPGAFIIHAIPVGWSIWLSLIKHLSLATIIASIQVTWPFILGELIQAVLAAVILSLAWKLLRYERADRVRGA